MMRSISEDDEPVHLWFGLSYAHWLTIPRIFLQEMPPEWQKRFVKCLEEFQEEFDWVPDDITFYVTARKKGKIVKLPDYGHYRHPDSKTIDSYRRPR